MEKGPVVLERFRAKWKPVRVKKTRRNKRLEPGFDSIKTEMALVPANESGRPTLSPSSLDPDQALVDAL